MNSKMNRLPHLREKAAQTTKGSFRGENGKSENENKNESKSKNGTNSNNESNSMSKSDDESYHLTETLTPPSLNAKLHKEQMDRVHGTLGLEVSKLQAHDKKRIVLVHHSARM